MIGVDLVLLPGMDGTGNLLAPFANRLAIGRTVKTVRYPSGGPQTYAALLEFARAALPDRACAILGESFSGPVAISLAASDLRVAGLILASTFARSPIPSVIAPFTFIDPNLVPFSIVSRALLGTRAPDEIVCRLRETLASVSGSVLRERARAVAGVDVTDLLRSVRCPVLSLQGRKDWLIRRALFRQLGECSPQCKVVWMNAPHMLLATHAEESAQVTDRFIQTIAARTS